MGTAGASSTFAPRNPTTAFLLGLCAGLLLAASFALLCCLASRRRGARRRRLLLEEAARSVKPGTPQLTSCVSNGLVAEPLLPAALGTAKAPAAAAAAAAPVGSAASPAAAVQGHARPSGGTSGVSQGSSSSSAVGCFDLLSSWRGSRKRPQPPRLLATRPETTLTSHAAALTPAAVPVVGEEVSDEDLRQLYLSTRARLLRTSKPSKSAARPELLRPAAAEGEVHRDASWLNSFVAGLWPKISEHVREIVHKTVEPLVDSKLPSVLKGCVRFEEVTLGSKAPRLSNLVVSQAPGGDAAQIRARLSLESDLRASVVAVGATVAISDLTLDGEVSFVFSPLAAKPPYFGGLQIFFVNPPALSFEVGGNVIPHGLQPALRAAVADAFAKFLVQPNRIAVDLDDEEGPDATDLKYPDPLAVLRLSLLRASGLRAADTSVLGGRSSDPYVVISLGATRWTSPTKKQTLAPVWAATPGEPGATVDLPVHSASQLARFEVYDADLVSSDFLGRRSDVHLLQLLGVAGAGGEEVAIRLVDADGAETAGAVFVSVRLLYLGAVPRPLSAAAAIGGPSGAYLCVKVLEVQGLPSDSQYPFKVRITVGATRSETKSSHIKANKGISASIQKVCIEQLRRGRPPALVADALGLQLSQVLTLGEAAEPTRRDVQQAVREAVALRAATDPFFEEAVQLLIPDPAAAGGAGCRRAVLQLVDRHGAVLGGAAVALGELLGAPGLALAGNVRLEPIGAELRGELRLRLLEP